MPRIAVLSEDLINQIAAGEVVERPASVVKELIENALDAGARSIWVVLKEGGLNLIQVSDDGQGMERADARTALLRHATSKLRDYEGLSNICTMGFRGEALPAIASVSRFSLLTSQPGDQVGTRAVVEGGGAGNFEDAAAAGGTVITVEDLFFNTPARRKFLKKTSTELAHCEEALLRVALTRPDVGFFATADGRPLLSSPGSDDPRERIAAALGTEVHGHLIPVEERRLSVTVSGYVASPEFTQPTQRGLYTFVNKRFVKDRALNHAIQRAFQDSLPPGRQPVSVLFIEVDPHDVDVNVHPQKLEVRFSDSRGVCDVVHAAVQRALKESPWQKISADSQKNLAGMQAHYALAVERFLTRAEEGRAPAAFFAQEGQSPAFGQLKPQLDEAPPPGFFQSLRLVGTLAQRFWICEGAGGTLLVIDPHAARERVQLSSVMARLEKNLAAPSQPFLFAATVELPATVGQRLQKRLPALARLGIELEPFGGAAWAIKSLPPELTGTDPAPLLTSLAELLPESDAPFTTAESWVEAARVVACRSAGSRGEPGEAEARALLAQLDRSDFSIRAKHRTIVLSESPFLEFARRAGDSQS